ncbi:MAG: DNA mismatch repair protein MutL [Phycisphaeraceae bacterium]|nr:MAG: DNA mismatch repair protein MutL [Phycisphaeraceae bacterium]
MPGSYRTPGRARRGWVGPAGGRGPVHCVVDATASEPARIKKLSAHLVNQIAAGEVIERPASVVKELVENAIDAGATNVRVELVEGGIELIRITDDGRGMTPEDLPLAIASHATSKLSQEADLDRIGTLGFRGEAVASIASVSRMTVRSRAAGADAASEIRTQGEAVEPVRPASGSRGTVVEVRNLYFNTPARRKFLRTPTTEKTRCVEWVRRLALAHPAVGFVCEGDGRRALDLPPGQTARERAIAVLGKDLESQLVEVSWDRFDDDRGVLIWGLAGLPSVARATASAQHVFLNGRWIRDKSIQHALREAYRGLIEPGRHPTAVLMLEMSPTAFDVNVHPAKLEVRFRDQSMVHQAVLRSVREALQRADLTPTVMSKLGYGSGARDAGGGVLPPSGGAGDPGLGEGGVEELRRALDPANEPWRAHTGAPPGGFIEARAPGAIPEPTPMATVRRADRVLQVHNSFLVTQDEHGVVIIDQHALHERVMFEKLLARVTGGGTLEQQRLLTPAVVEADEDLVGRLDELAPVLAKVGVEAAALGPRTIGVHAYPSFLQSRGVEPDVFVKDLLERFARDGLAPDTEEALHEVLDMMACKAAIKAGDTLSDEEMGEILEMRARTERSGSCPHGRPTTVRLTITELEKLFDRR